VKHLNTEVDISDETQSSIMLGYLRENASSLYCVTSTLDDWFVSLIKFAESGQTITIGSISISSGSQALERTGDKVLEGPISLSSETRFTLAENGAILQTISK
jgi:hypothetical protein